MSLRLDEFMPLARRGRRPLLPRPLTAGFDAGRLSLFRQPNGSGKSSLFRSIAGLSPHTGTAERGGPMLYLDQHAGEYHHPLLTLAENVAHLLGREARWSATAAALSIDRLAEPLLALDRTALSASGGERQFAIVAAALSLSHVRVLLLDEPFVSLDSPREAVVWELIARALDRGAAVLLAAHGCRLPDPIVPRTTTLDSWDP
jgi:ABC-type Mn2+/Zn2+ transport system ATPase subunit